MVHERQTTNPSQMEKRDRAVQDAYRFVELGTAKFVRETEQLNPLDVLHYHVFDPHYIGVAERNKRLLTEVHRVAPDLVTYTDVVVGESAGLFHDFEYRSELVTDPHTIFPTSLRRKARIGHNERNSAVAFMQYMMERGFSWTEIQAHYFGIRDLTIPAYDSVYKTIFQPKLNENAPMPGRTLALADLGCGGMEGPEAFEGSGFAVAREDYPELVTLPENFRLLRAKDQEQELVVALQHWIDAQVAFLQGREALLSREVANFERPEVRDAILSQFSHFGENITHMRQLSHDARHNLSPTELFQRAGLVDPRRGF